MQDPAITSVTEPPPPRAEDYNPFADQPPAPSEVCVARKFCILDTEPFRGIIILKWVLNYLQGRFDNTI